MRREDATFDVCIEAIAYRLGSRAETGADLARDNPAWNIGEIEAKTGVKTRHVAAEGETAADIAATAARDLWSQGVDPARIGALIFVTQSPDHLLPTTACLLQERLGLPKSCIAFDINQGCSGFVYGLGVSASLIQSGSPTRCCCCAPTRTADTSRRTIARAGRCSATLPRRFLVARREGASMGPFVFGSDGSGGENLIVRGGGARDAAAATQAPPRS
jgi:3-oxoacyl-[acyl-carrier-protein] synthase-3